MPIGLFAHNQKAYDSATAMMDEAGRAAIIHPTGTGKSFIAFKMAEEHPQARVFWLSPSRYIFRQQQENLARSCPGSVPENITFMTYTRLMANRDRISALKPDYIILDEFHRCGAAQWSKGVEALLSAFPMAKVLGLSATSVRYLDGQRDMADELFDGHIASEITLGEAIARGILTNPCYVISVYRCENEIEKYAARVRQIQDPRRRAPMEQHLQRLRHALEKADGLPVIFKRYLKPEGKYLVFCAGRVHLEEMKAQADAWFALVNREYRLYSVYSENQESNKEFGDFKKDRCPHLKLLFCIDMLNEGIHLGDIDGVILMRPTVSPVIYKQQIGRALTAGKKGEAPLILDIVNNFENLDSIHSIEMEYEEASNLICPMQDERADGMESRRFHIVDETCHAGRLFAELQEKLDAGWEEYYQAAVSYHEREGHLEIPTGFVTESGLFLGNWLQTQRRIYMGKLPGRLNEDQIRRLEVLGICWESYSDRQWDRYYAQAARYYAQNGNLDVKISYVTEEGMRLGVWLNNIRQYRQNKSRMLSGQRQRQLEEIGMIWDKLVFKWERGYAAAEEYVRDHGDLEVPAGYVTKDGFHLGTWIVTQRQNFRGGNKGALPLTEEQVARLEKLGMNWAGKQDGQWERCFQAAREYQERHASLEIPYDYRTEDGIWLGKWLYNQKRILKKQRGSSDRERSRMERLKELGLNEDEDPWMEKWRLAQRYYVTHGNLEIPQNYVSEEGVWLGKWVYLQRSRYRKGGELSREQIRALTSVGMCWLTPAEQAWENAFLKAERYFKEQGHLNVEKGYMTEDGFRLDLWLERQRKGYREGKRKVLSQERVERLEKMGMKW
ncbi:MAG: DEAD/DEAH box helicase family protein [Lachnospiraceae bacterium]|nr:DEAD/DEAH box helicase family protein [Lachnospiraceae bacterium]